MGRENVTVGGEYYLMATQPFRDVHDYEGKGSARGRLDGAVVNTLPRTLVCLVYIG